MTSIPAHATEVVAEAEGPLGGPRVNFYTLTTAKPAGRDMTLAIPASRLLEKVAAANHGIVNLAVVAETPAGPHAWFTPVHLSPAPAAAKVRLPARVAAGPSAALAVSAGPARTRACVFFRRGHTEGTTRIGELHVSRVGNSEMVGHYENQVDADSTSSIGGSATGGPGSFSGEGNVTVSSGFSDAGTWRHKGKLGQYLDGHIYYGKYQGEGTFCVANWLIEEYNVVGDVFPGNRAAPPNPYGDCHQDPNGYATVPGGGTYYAQKSIALTYGGSFVWFGFGFSESNGFTHDVREKWDNNGRITTYVCGNRNPVGASGVFYNENP